MNTILRLAPVATMLAAALSASADTRFEADFEAAAPTNKAPAGWAASPAGEARWEQGGRRGQRSLYIGNVGHPTDAPTWSSAPIAFSGPAALRVSGWLARGYLPGSDNSYGIELALQFTDAEGRELAVRRGLALEPYPLGERRTRYTDTHAMDWTYTEARVAPPSNACQVRLIFRHSWGGGATLTHGEGWLDDVQLTQEAVSTPALVPKKDSAPEASAAPRFALDLNSDVMANVFNPGDPIVFDAFLQGPFEAAGLENLALAYRVSDSANRIVEENRLTLSAASQPYSRRSRGLLEPLRREGRVVVLQLGPAVTRSFNGFFRLDAWLEQGGRRTASASTALATLAPRYLPPGRMEESRIGIRGWGPEIGLPNPKRPSLRQQLGLYWVNHSSGIWIQPTPTNEALIGNIQLGGLDPADIHSPAINLPYIHPLRRHPLWADDPSKGAPGINALRPEAFATWIEAMVPKYRDRFHYWYIDGEWPAESRDVVAACLPALHAAVRKHDPRGRIVLYGDPAWGREPTAEMARYVDVFDFHSYSTHQALEETLVKTTLPYFNRIAPGKPVWNTEFCANQREALGDLDTASEMAKLFAVQFMAGVERLFWYRFVGGGSYGAGYPFNLVYTETGTPQETLRSAVSNTRFRPFLTLLQLANVVRYLDFTQPVGKFEHEGILCYSFEREGRGVSLLWQKDITRPARLIGLPADGPVEVVALPFEKVELDPWQGRVHVAVPGGGRPLFLLTPAPLKAFAPSPPAFDLQPGKGPVLEGDAVLLAGRIPNSSDAMRYADVSVQADRRWQTTQLQYRVSPAVTNGAFAFSLKAGPELPPGDYGLSVVWKVMGRPVGWWGDLIAIRPAALLELTQATVNEPARQGVLLTLANKGKAPFQGALSGRLKDAAGFRPAEFQFPELRLERGQTLERFLPVEPASMPANRTVEAEAAATDSAGTVLATSQGLHGYYSATPAPDGALTFDSPLWQHAPRFVLNRYESNDLSGKGPEQHELPYYSPLKHRQWHGDTNDLSATLQVAWNKEALYFLMDVLDDVHVNEGRPGNLDIWNGDAIQFWIRTASGATADGAALINGGKDTAVYRYGGPLPTTAPDGPKVAWAAQIRRDGPRTRYLVCLPPKAIPHVLLAAGQTLRLNVWLHEEDVPGGRPRDLARALWSPYAEFTLAPHE